MQHSSMVQFCEECGLANDPGASSCSACQHPLAHTSSSTKSPSIRIAGRLRNDIKSTLRGEIEVKAGTANQVASAQRWGDYSTMQIDPDDDCTFWYTTEYTSANTPTSANWATQIIGFKFNNCQ